MFLVFYAYLKPSLLIVRVFCKLELSKIRSHDREQGQVIQRTITPETPLSDLKIVLDRCFFLIKGRG